jgi:hypothetical protein
VADPIRFKDFRHLVHAAVLIAAVMVAFLVVRALIVPQSFGQYGHYRGESIQERQNLPVILEYPETCRECHEEELKRDPKEPAVWPGLDTWQTGKHGSLTCANCHGNLKEHVERQRMDPAPTEFVVTKDIRPQLCLLCHHAMVARPAVLPIFDPKEEDHVNFLAVLEEELDEIVGCDICHPSYRPHDPKLTE